MKILITGGLGFIGSTLSGYLLDNGHEIIALDTYEGTFSAPLTLQNNRLDRFKERQGYRFHKIDMVKNPKRLENLIRTGKPDAVVHLAAFASVPQSEKDPTSYIDNNIDAVINLYASLNGSGLTAPVLYASSSSVYGGDTPLPASENFRTQNPLSIYAASKIGKENAAQLYAERFNIPSIAMRFFNVYGPDGRPDGVVRRFITAAINGAPLTIFGTGDANRDYTYVGDVCRAIEALIHGVQSAKDMIFEPGKNHKTLNIAGSNPSTLNDMVAILKQDFPDLGLVYGPERPGDIPQSHADTTELQRILGGLGKGFNFTPLNKALPHVIQIEQETVQIEAKAVEMPATAPLTRRFFYDVSGHEISFKRKGYTRPTKPALKERQGEHVVTGGIHVVLRLKEGDYYLAVERSNKANIVYPGLFSRFSRAVYGDIDLATAQAFADLFIMARQNDRLQNIQIHIPDLLLSSAHKSAIQSDRAKKQDALLEVHKITPSPFDHISISSPILKIGIGVHETGRDGRRKPLSGRFRVNALSSPDVKVLNDHNVDASISVDLRHLSVQDIVALDGRHDDEFLVRKIHLIPTGHLTQLANLTPAVREFSQLWHPNAHAQEQSCMIPSSAQPLVHSSKDNDFLSPGKNLMVVVAHTDDEILGAWETIYRAREKGMNVRVVYAHNVLPQAYKICKEALEDIGAETVMLFNERVNLTDNSREAIKLLGEQYATFNPDVVISHAGLSGEHQEHREVAALTKIAHQRYEASNNLHVPLLEMLTTERGYEQGWRFDIHLDGSEKARTSKKAILASLEKAIGPKTYLNQHLSPESFRLWNRYDDVGPRPVNKTTPYPHSFQIG